MWCDVMWYDVMWWDEIWCEVDCTAVHCTSQHITSHCSFSFPLFLYQLSSLIHFPFFPHAFSSSSFSSSSLIFFSPFFSSFLFLLFPSSLLIFLFLFFSFLRKQRVTPEGGQALIRDLNEYCHVSHGQHCPVYTLPFFTSLHFTSPLFTPLQ